MEIDLSLNKTDHTISNHPKPLLKALDISHNFDYPLFSNINIDLHKKESLAIVGSSGCGKSTLLNIFSTLLKPKSGEVLFDGKSIYSLKKEEILKIRREYFGIIFQAHYLFRGFNAKENLEISSILNSTTIDESLLKLLHIDHIINQNIGTLSGGQQQRLSIARILTKKPKIIFADEPTGNLDKETASIVFDTLFEYIKKENGALVLVTHEMDLANRCDRVFKLQEQRLIQIK
ncbi:MAG: ATP-binding cassette domain-containing protein [Arcobacter butzleri]|jgi:putative ABC transport system ATP-binding protein|nr:ATP-binding cassette domain-containing protein [Arcobacteraceae bacterium]MDY0364750.1 ATP-binding cassette domain-containing protein [Arcobacteraceae bacterium]NLO16997.1 ATP-binding cassette domain-containing protein [Aliarcobacter butzleri]